MDTKVKFACGSLTDCEELLGRFIKTNSVRFEEFTKIWCNMNLSMIFLGRQNDLELYEFTVELLWIAKRFWLSPHDFQMRVCGLYLLYGFYMKQPLLPKVKIRLTLSEWREGSAFLKDALQQQHYDVAYVYLTLLKQNAFDFVFFPIEINHSLKGQERLHEEEQRLSKSSKSHLMDYINESSHNVLEVCHQRYLALKNSLSDTEAVPSFVDPEAFTKITRIVKECQEKMNEENPKTAKSKPKPEPRDPKRKRKRRRQKQKAIDADDIPIDDDQVFDDSGEVGDNGEQRHSEGEEINVDINSLENEDIGQRRAKLKERQMTRKAPVSGNRRSTETKKKAAKGKEKPKQREQAGGVEDQGVVDQQPTKKKKKKKKKQRGLRENETTSRDEAAGEAPSFKKSTANDNSSSPPPPSSPPCEPCLTIVTDEEDD